ncbi:peptidylprolyl isomerase [bacterium]|nr:peptidylprolyl isomerase [bacterium]
MRKNTATVLWILVFAFIGTIIFSWGMGGFKGQYEPGVLAKVNGVKITREQYDQALQNRFNYERQVSETGEIDENRTDQLRTEVWDGLVNEILLNQAREKSGIVVGDKEIAIAVKNNPPASITSSPNFVDSTGSFDWNFYYSVLADPQNIDFVVSIENNIRQQLLQQKMLSRIASVDHISDLEAKQSYIRDNTKGTVSYILVATRDFVQDTTGIADQELRSAYRSRQDEFKIEENRVVEMASIPDEPSREDSLDARRLIDHVLDRLSTGATFEEMAREYSEDGSAQEGGDLGWFGRGRMVKPFEEAAFSANIGDVVGPVQSQFGYHLIRVDDRRTDDKGDPEVKARHILVRVERSPETLDDIRNRADAFREEAEEQGFHEAARIFNIEVDTLTKVSRSGFIPRIGRNKAASEFLFNRPKGDISPVYSFRDGFAVLRVIEVKKAGVKPFEEVRGTLLKDLADEHRLDKASQRADSLYQLVEAGQSLDQVAAAAGLEIQATSREFKMGEYIAGVGRDAHFSVAALEMDEGDISKPVRTDKGYFLIRLDNKTVPEMDNWAEIRDEQIGRIYSQRQNIVLNSWIEQQRDKADIDDYRYLYYTDY